MWILKPGDLFDQRYRIEREIGSGGMAYVYAVTDEELQDTVALKVIKPELVAEPELVERFKREVRIARQINHPNIVRIFEFGRTDLEGKIFYYLTMELLKGVDLGNWLMERGSIALNETVDIGIQLCDALGEAHGKGVIHRDIKPQNIFIDEGGRATLMDFGISRLATLTGLTRGSQLMGTPRYMSPEQVSGGKTELDHRSDLYSLGIVLYELCTRQVPFSGETPVEVAIRHIQEKPQPPRELNARIPETLEKIILNCLEKDPGSRYDSAKELAVALQETAQVLGVETQEIPSLRQNFEERETTPRFIKARATSVVKDDVRAMSLPPALSPSRRHGVTIRTKVKKRKWLAGGLIGVAVIAALGFLWMFASRDTPREPELGVEGSEPMPLEGTEQVGTSPQPSAEPESRSALETTSSTPLTGPIPVRISANPGTSIFVDGIAVGTVPPVVRYELAAGEHRIRYVIPDYDEFEETVNVSHGRDNRFSHRFPLFGVLRVVCRPYASVRLNGRDLGYTPVNLNKVREGEHRLVLHREGYETIEESVSVRPGQINLFRYSLVRR